MLEKLSSTLEKATLSTYLNTVTQQLKSIYCVLLPGRMYLCTEPHKAVTMKDRPEAHYLLFPAYLTKDCEG